MNLTCRVTLITLCLLAPLAACEQKTAPTSATPGADTTRANTAPQAPAPDNTATNKADRSGDTKTPMDQSASPAHIKITADIRRAIMDDKAMSMNAQNCKIVTDAAGMVTLRGVVDSQAERTSIDAKAKQIAGATRVNNQLEVKST